MVKDVHTSSRPNSRRFSSDLYTTTTERTNFFEIKAYVLSSDGGANVRVQGLCMAYGYWEGGSGVWGRGRGLIIIFYKFSFYSGRTDAWLRCLMAKVEVRWMEWRGEDGSGLFIIMCACTCWGGGRVERCCCCGRIAERVVEKWTRHLSSLRCL